MKQRRELTWVPSLPGRDVSLANVGELRAAYCFTVEGEETINLGVHAAQSLGHSYFGSEHFLLGLTHELSAERMPRATRVLSSLAIDQADVWNTIVDIIGPGPSTHTLNDTLPLTLRARTVANRMRKRRGTREFDSIDILVGILKTKGSVGQLTLEKHGLISPGPLPSR